MKTLQYLLAWHVEWLSGLASTGGATDGRTVHPHPSRLHAAEKGAHAMMRKSVLLITTFVMCTLPLLCHAQSEQQQPSLDSVIEVVRANMQADKITVITQAMNFSDKDAAAFWPIYRSYESERSALDDRRVAVIKQYAAKYPALSESEAKAMAEQMFDCDSGIAALKKKYYKKFNTVLPALTVTKFFQLDHRIDLVMDMKVESSLPPLTNSPQPDAPSR